MAELLTAHIADWIGERPAEARAWWQLLARIDPDTAAQLERIRAMNARLAANPSPSAVARMRRAYDDCVLGITSKRIRAGQPSPIFPSFNQAFKAGFAIDSVNEERDDRNRLLHADTVVRLAEGSVVARLVARKHLTTAQGATAALYLSIWESAGMTMRVTGSYGEGTGGGAGASPMPQTQAMAIARSELRALRAAIGTDIWRLVERVVIDDETVTAMGLAAYPPWQRRPSRRTATRTGMRVLKKGLNDAAAHFHGLKRRRKRYATAKAATSDERQAYFAKGADQDAVRRAMRANRERKAKRAEARAARSEKQ